MTGEIRTTNEMPKGYLLVDAFISQSPEALRVKYGKKVIWVPKSASCRLSNGTYAAARWAIKNGLNHVSAEDTQ